MAFQPIVSIISDDDNKHWGKNLFHFFFPNKSVCKYILYWLHLRIFRSCFPPLCGIRSTERGGENLVASILILSRGGHLRCALKWKVACLGDLYLNNKKAADLTVLPHPNMNAPSGRIPVKWGGTQSLKLNFYQRYHGLRMVGVSYDENLFASGRNAWKTERWQRIVEELGVVRRGTGCKDQNATGPTNQYDKILRLSQWLRQSYQSV